MSNTAVERTSIQISHDTRERLFDAKHSSTETYDAVITRLLEAHQ